MSNFFKNPKRVLANVFSGGGNGPDLGYKAYKALLTQSGTNAPVATVLVNTLSGTPVWSYGTVGRYLLTLVGEFDASKTMIFISNNDIISLFSCYRLNDDVIRLECSDLSLVKADDLVNGLPITIEVYP